MRTLLFLLCFTPFLVAAQACPDNKLVLQLNTGDWAEEISWSITDTSGNTITTSTQTYLDSSTYHTTICLEDGCYFFNMYDSYGDGWQGGSFTLVDSSLNSLTSGYLGPQMAFDSLPFCAPFQPPPPCNSNLLNLQLNTGAWASEIAWSITDSLGNTLDSSNQIYNDNSQYLIEVCLNDGCYQFNMYDSYGDGWQGASYQLINSLGYILSSGDLEGTVEFGQQQFSVNSTSCPVLGCTLPTAANYNPSATINDTSCTLISDNINLLQHWFVDTLPTNNMGGRYTEVYGVAINNKEFAIIGSTMGTHIIEVTVPEEAIEVAYIPGAYQGNVIHRDYHTMGNYLYAVCDQGASSLQIIDISNLPDSATVVYDSDELFSNSHNIFIDTLHSKLYSTNGGVYDLTNPTNPTLLFDMGFSCHDLYVENDTGYFNCTTNGLQIYEMTNNTPVYLESLTFYPDIGTNHSGWKSGNTYIFADENHGLDLKVADVSDLSNISIIALFNSGVDSNSIAHNLIIKDQFVYVSYYHDGLQVFDISDPGNPIKAAYYDTFLPDHHNGYAGNWGVYPLLPSGNILVSDIQSGLFVLELEYEQESICEGDSFQMGASSVHTAGFHIEHVIDTLGYEDILLAELSINPTSFEEQAISILYGDSLLLEGSYQYTNGIYTDTLSNQFGCDSIVITNLSIELVNSWDCIENNCLESNNGDGQFATYSECINLCITPPAPSWDCIDNTCIDLKDGSGTYTTIEACEKMCQHQTDIIETKSNSKQLLRITDLLGQEIPLRKNTPMFFIYDDGTVEKKIIIE